MKRYSHRQRGLFMPEVVVALAVVTFVMTIFVMAAGRQMKGSQRLQDSRAATLLAEDAMLALQRGGDVAGDKNAVQVKALETTSSVKGMKWASVNAQVNGRKATLVGLVPADAKVNGGAP